MKKILLPVLLGLTLSACSTNFPTQYYSLTVNVSGPSSATVVVTDTTSNKEVFNSAVTGSATIPNLTELHVYTVAGQAVTGFTPPASQSVTLKSNSSVQLTYTAAAQ